MTFSANKVISLMLVLMTVMLAAVAAQSLQWRMEHDSALFVYTAYLMDHFGYVPYVDFLDMNMPGVHLLTRSMTAIFGYGDWGFRICDLLWLGVTLIITALWTRRLGTHVAWFSTVAVGLWYLHLGQHTSMQRDYLLLLPIGLAIHLVVSTTIKSFPAKAFASGVLMALCFLVKPTAAIGLPCLLGYLLVTARDDMPEKGWLTWQNLAMVVCASVGFALPLVAIVFKLWLNGSLHTFLDTATNYWPLYGAISGKLEYVPDPAIRLASRWKEFTGFGGFTAILVPTMLGIFISFFNAEQDSARRRIVLLTASLAVAYAIHTFLAGKYWAYQWLEFAYFAIVLASLCLLSPPIPARNSRILYPAIVLFVAMAAFISPPAQFMAALTGKPLFNQNLARADQIGEFLKKRLKPHDRVQALDWTGGAIQGMLIARAQPATTFLVDAGLYCRVSHPYIQKWRLRFIKELQESKPRFIIQVETNRPWITGPDTSKEFPELEDLLKSHYTAVFEGDGYSILERKNGV